MRHFPGGGMSGMNLLFGFLGFIGTLVALALLTLLVFYLVKRSKGGVPGGPHPMGHHPGHRPPVPPALHLLDERLARG